MKFYITLLFSAISLLLVYYFSYSIQLALSTFIRWVGRKVGSVSKTGEFELQKYVFMHSTSLVSKFYNFLNVQIIILNLKTAGVTPLGFLLFWSIVSLIVSVVFSVIMSLSLTLLLPVFLLFLVMELIIIRVSISERMEKREMCVMDAVDLLIPELGNGVFTAIMANKSNFPAVIRGDFNMLEVNVSKVKMSFTDAMIVLSDSLGVLFREFAQKAINYEISGEPDELTTFSVIIETNRLRRDLRDVNNKKFAVIRRDFIITTAIMVVYAFYTMTTDEFTREFFLQSSFGKIVALLMFADTLGALTFIATLKSKTL